MVPTTTKEKNNNKHVKNGRRRHSSTLRQARLLDAKEEEERAVGAAVSLATPKIYLKENFEQFFMRKTAAAAAADEQVQGKEEWWRVVRMGWATRYMDNWTCTLLFTSSSLSPFWVYFVAMFSLTMDGHHIIVVILSGY